MKTVLVPLFDQRDVPAQVSSAVAIARQFEAMIEAFCFKPVYYSPAVFYAEPIAVDDNFESVQRERAAILRDEFLRCIRGHELPVVDADQAATAPCARWRDQAYAGYSYVGHRARLFDLIVVAQGLRPPDDNKHGILEAALFESGRPILVVPPELRSDLGRRVVLAWNGSDESVRAMVFALPILRRAAAVSVVSVQGGMVPGPDAGDIVTYLHHHGIQADAVDLAPKGGGVGEAILEQTTRLQADLIVKGAYTHSRLRQMIFGGPTRHILEYAAVPVFMAH